MRVIAGCAAASAAIAGRSARSMCVERKPAPPLQPRQPGLLQADVVVGIEVVQAQHALAAAQQGLGDMVADEPGGAGQQDGHAPI